MKRPDRRPALLANLRRQPDRDAALQRYARLAHDYEGATTKIRDVRRRAIDRLALRSGETVFDVACGAGAMLPELARRVGPQGRVIGIEQSPQMAALSRRAAIAVGHVEVHACPVEEFVAPRPADALVFVYAHDVQQNPAALRTVFAQARPGARVVAAGLCLLPWWGLPINAWVLWGARHYLTTWHGLRRPWQGLLDWCPDLQIVERFHDGTTYLAIGTVAPP
ncbi:MAG: methyltransferase domain-containing protein [Burkholderiaceae bacterium]|nr:methyltransferase domain-containing protein [Burkholderiaceae bacterium]